MRNNITVFPIQATQYISGSGPTLRLAEYDITVRHDTKVSIVGELDIHNNKLYLDLHNFDFLSINTAPQFIPTHQISSNNSTPTVLSEKRSLMYKSLFDNPKTTTPPKRNRTNDTVNQTPSTTESSRKHKDTDSTSTVESDQDSLKPVKKESTQKRQLRSDKIVNLASKKLNLPPYDEQ